MLLGDSILDNAPYTTPKPDTAAHLRRLIGERWSIEVLARDVARMARMQEQLVRIDRPATAVLSVGGNDVTRHVGMLAKPARAAQRPDHRRGRGARAIAAVVDRPDEQRYGRVVVP